MLENPEGTLSAEEPEQNPVIAGGGADWYQENVDLADQEAAIDAEVARLRKDIDDADQAVQSGVMMERYSAENGFDKKATSQFLELKVKTDEMRIRQLEERKARILAGETNLSDEKFQPELELEAIRRAPAGEKAELMREFREKLSQQKEGLAYVQEQVLAEIRKNPDISADSLKAFAGALGKEYGINDEQTQNAEAVIDAYREKHEGVRKARLQYPDDAKLFNHLFGKDPAGKVEVVEGPMTLYVRCYDQGDYAFIHGYKFLNRDRTVTPGDIAVANMSGGVYIGDCLDTSLYGTIIAENTAQLVRAYPSDEKTRSENSNRIHTHEEQHAINPLFIEKMQFMRWIDRARNAKTEEDVAAVFRSVFRETRIHKAERRAKDEILAYFKDRTPPTEILKLLLVKKSEGGLYDYLHTSETADPSSFVSQYLGADEKKLHKAVPRIMADVRSQVFGQEYETLLNKGVAALMRLELDGYTPDRAIALLVHEPLARWEKVVSRLRKEGPVN